MFVCPQCGESYSETGFCGSDGSKLNPAADDNILGTSIGPYRIASLLGVGGWGRVYLGVQSEIGSRVAIKILKHDPTGNPGLVTRFFNEARAVNLIRHENIVNIIDLAQLPDGRMYITMEYLDGLPLSKHIANKGRLDISETCRICSQVLDALAAAHAKGIIHRDLKPDNLFVSPEGRAKILDFGIAKLRDSEDANQTREGSLMGTPHFMSPEQALARPVDPRSDLYSMGVILYDCLTGSLPFHAASAFELTRAHIEQAPQPLRQRCADIPEELDALVLMALEKDPNLRWQSAEDMSTALKRIGHANPGQKTKSLASQPSPMSIDPTMPADAVLTQTTPQYATLQADSESLPKANRKVWWIAAALLLLGGVVAIALLATKGSGDASKSPVAAPNIIIDNLTLINVTVPIEGVASQEPQHYKLEALAGQELTFVVRTESAAASTIQLSLLTSDGQKLALTNTGGKELGDDQAQYTFDNAQEAQTFVVAITGKSEEPTPFQLTTRASAAVAIAPPETPEVVEPVAELTVVDAETVSFESALEGTVETRHARQYRFTAAQGQTTRFKIYADLVQPEAYLVKYKVRVTAEDGALLQEREFSTLAHLPENPPQEEIFEFVVVDAQSPLLTIENWSNESAVHYKIVSEAVASSTLLTGGPTADAAEQVHLEEGVAGVLNKEQTRFYRFDCIAGQAYEISLASKSMQPGAYTATMSLKLTGESGATLASAALTTFKDITNSEPDTASVFFAIAKAQSVLMTVESTDKDTPIQYQIKTKRIGPSFPLSGGLTPEEAELVDLKTPIEGVIDTGESRHYRYKSKKGQTTVFTTYTEMTKPKEYNATIDFSALAEDGEKLGGGKANTMVDILTPELKKTAISVVSKEPGTVLLILHNETDDSPVHYKLVPVVTQGK